LSCLATNLAGKIVLEPKDHMAGRGVSSPDKADALALAFAPAPGEGLLEWSRGRGQSRETAKPKKPWYER
jgi:hypothetical protein